MSGLPTNLSALALAMAAAKENKNRILETLLDDYVRAKTKNKLQYLLVKTLAMETHKAVPEGHRGMYALTRLYLSRNAAEVTRHLIFEE